MDKRSESNLAGIHPDLKKVMTEAQLMRPSFIIVCGVRTTAEQQALFAQGRTKPGLRVTNCDGISNRSNHQVHKDGLGYAVDVYCDANGNGVVDSVEINDIAGLKKVADNVKATAKRLGVNVEWGGDWKMKDYPHFEFKN
ncbi:MAG: M15 family metallopeptidase [Prevotellaceae bacterium]|jgi:peptidoglycan L-alanyl-D-glutamate endopeptidase CwlK|nr:M15 family metallopeptidase [Prevotellaceae bacterium]